MASYPRDGGFMFRRNSQILGAWFLFWDLVVTTAAWWGAYGLRFQTGWIPVWKEMPDVSMCWRNLPLVLVLAGIAYHLLGQYSIHRLRRFREEVVGAFKGAALLSLLVTSSTFFLHDPYES